MINVRCDVKAYDCDYVVRVHSDSINDRFVTLEVGDNHVRVSGLDLITAVKSCMIVNKI